MTKIKKSTLSGRKAYLVYASICLAALVVIVAFVSFMPMSTSDKKEYIYIDKDDTVDSVYTKMGDISHGYSLMAFKIMSRHAGYADKLRTGRYAMEPSDCPITVFRHMKNGQQEPVRLTVPSVRTTDRLAEELSKHLMLSSDAIFAAISDQNTCKKYGEDTLNIQCLFIPNTYEVYWDLTTDQLLERMKKESDRFWNDERTKKAEALGLTREQVITLASIIDEETANNAEKPMIAGMYLNRYNSGMPLQADPTVKYALKKFELKRIYNEMLRTPSPFNTYRNTGLPPGPIRIPSVAGIDAVLNRVKHDYMFMCAKEDFSGTHNFAVTYQEHMQNAKKYTDALNNRGIK